MGNITAPYEDRIAIFKYCHGAEMLKQALGTLKWASQSRESDPRRCYPLWTAFYILYAKPFKHKRELGIRLDDDLIPEGHKKIHSVLIKTRDKLIAHSDIKDLTAAEGYPVDSIKFAFTKSEVKADLTIIAIGQRDLMTVHNLLADVINGAGKRAMEIWDRYPGALVLSGKKYRLNIARKSDDLLVPA